MLFEKDKYYKEIGTLEKIVNFYYAILIGICGLVGLIGGITGLIIGIGIGFLLATITTSALKVKIQEMKWKLDIYELITDIKKK